MTLKRSIVFTDPQADWLRQEASRLGISFADAVRRVIDHHREEKNVEPRHSGADQRDVR